MTSLNSYIEKITQGTVLSEKEMALCIRLMMQGEANDIEMQNFLIALFNRGEQVSEITGAARVMREMATTINAPENALDCCGTGGDGQNTYNISTAVALVSAACGVPIAKHGNRSASSKSGAADVLEQLGVNLDATKEHLETALKELGFCFLMAPKHHSAMKYVVPVRKKLGHRTIFNLLGPLANPADTKFQLIGVYDKKWLRPMAEVLNNLGTKKAWLVHGQDGLDEITVTAPTDIVILDNGIIEEKIISPKDFGLPLHKLEEIKGGDAKQNADALLDILQGKENAYRDIVVINTAAVLMINDKSQNFIEAKEMALHAITSGKAMDVLNNYIKFSNEG